MEIFVPDYDWNEIYSSIDEYVKEGGIHGELVEGAEFKLVRLNVVASTTYRIVNGKPTPIVLAFPERIE